MIRLDMSTTAQFKAKFAGVFDSGGEIKHHFSDGLYAKEFFIPAGYIVGQHEHNYSHLSILAKGRVLVKTDEETKEIVGPAALDMPAKTIHLIKALEDSVWFCIHATEETESDNMDKVLIHEEV